MKTAAAVIALFLSVNLSAATWTKEPSRVFGVAFRSTEHEVRRARHLNPHACRATSGAWRVCVDHHPVAPFHEITFGFIHERLVMVDAEFSMGDANAAHLMQRFEDDYGQPTDAAKDATGELIFWRGKNVTLAVHPVNPSTGDGFAMFALNDEFDAKR